MIRIAEEIKKYEAIDFTENTFVENGELAGIFQMFEKNIKRFGKEQYKTTGHLEEILEILEERGEKEEVNRELRKEIKNKDGEINGLLDSILMIADSLEDIYRYTVKGNQDSWAEQISLLWRQLGIKLSPYGIIRIEGEGTKFSPIYHIAEEVQNNINVPHGEVLEVLQAGYIYRGRVIRKASVIVNHNAERMDYNE